MKIRELWRPVVGYEGLYEVSSEGRVRGLKTGKTLSPNKTRWGYYMVHLSKDGIKIALSIHRLVARAFPEICGRWFEGCQVNHRNEVKTDNRACNLEVCTAKYNTNYGTCIERRAKTHSKAVYQLTFEGKVVRAWESIENASKALNVPHSNIISAIAGRRKSCGGFKWQYA